jgi:hypothetical protein
MRRSLSVVLTPALLAAVCMLLLASCAYPAPHYGVKPVTGFIRPNDDARLDCSAAEVLLPVAATDSVWARCEWWQSGVMLKSDSTRTPRNVWITFQPPLEVPTAAQVESRWFARDVGGTACMTKIPQIPSQTLVRPAAFSGLSVVP